LVIETDSISMIGPIHDLGSVLLPEGTPHRLVRGPVKIIGSLTLPAPDERLPIRDMCSLE
jgi:hypothetical protein